MPSDDAGTMPEAYAETPAIATQPTAVAVVLQETQEKDARFPEAGRSGESSVAMGVGVMARIDGCDEVPKPQKEPQMETQARDERRASCYGGSVASQFPE